VLAEPTETLAVIKRRTVKPERSELPVLIPYPNFEKSL
jgi:hypothetical protein